MMRCEMITRENARNECREDVKPVYVESSPTKAWFSMPVESDPANNLDEVFSEKNAELPGPTRRASIIKSYDETKRAMQEYQNEIT
eukprot:CAMPEP_0113688566 /NCGR_PEP_ID=MMETSP0038_2-20120614/16612_1 /TAXON_ID=2898 /ORGANISM="Cryptomonas paramecium" /LENGTH=85 /DNA_ID=CAMNT_0000609405 /DNA_START=39 /DNA_END=293 /DNA_ORIENTATION=+ /assembly_acc=CAM_ASM_000170